MIKVDITAKDDKIKTNFIQKDITIGEVALVIREFEALKLELLDKDFNIDEIKYDDENDD